MKKIDITIYIKKMVMIFIVLAVLIDSETMYRYLISSPLFERGFGWVMGFLCLLYILMTKRVAFDRLILFKLPLLVFYLLIYIIFNGYNRNRFLVGYVGTFVCMFLFSYYLFKNKQMKLFLKTYSDVMLAVCLISMFCWFFGSILNVLPGRTTATYYWAEHFRTTYTYAFLYFENPSQNFGHNAICNLGIFAESPGFSGFLTYGLLVELVLRKDLLSKKEIKINTLRISIYILTLITTSSTKGIIAILIALLIEYLSKDARRKPLLILKIVIGILLFGMVVFSSMYLVGNKLTTSSGIVRMDDMLSGFRTFLQYPLMGAGYNNVEAIIKNQLVKRNNSGVSMGVATLLAYGGLWIFCIYLGAAYNSLKNDYFRKNRKTWYLIICVLLYNLFISNSGFSDPYIFMIASAYAMPMGTSTSGYNLERMAFNATKS